MEWDIRCGYYNPRKTSPEEIKVGSITLVISIPELTSPKAARDAVSKADQKATEMKRTVIAPPKSNKVTAPPLVNTNAVKDTKTTIPHSNSSSSRFARSGLRAMELMAGEADIRTPLPPYALRHPLPREQSPKPLPTKTAIVANAHKEKSPSPPSEGSNTSTKEVKRVSDTGNTRKRYRVEKQRKKTKDVVRAKGAKIETAIGKATIPSGCHYVGDNDEGRPVICVERWVGSNIYQQEKMIREFLEKTGGRIASPTKKVEIEARPIPAAVTVAKDNQQGTKEAVQVSSSNDTEIVTAKQPRTSGGNKSQENEVMKLKQIQEEQLELVKIRAEAMIQQQDADHAAKMKEYERKLEDAQRTNAEEKAKFDALQREMNQMKQVFQKAQNASQQTQQVPQQFQDARNSPQQQQAQQHSEAGTRDHGGPMVGIETTTTTPITREDTPSPFVRQSSPFGTFGQPSIAPNYDKFGQPSTVPNIGTFGQPSAAPNPRQGTQSFPERLPSQTGDPDIQMQELPEDDKPASQSHMSWTAKSAATSGVDDALNQILRMRESEQSRRNNQASLNGRQCDGYDADVSSDENPSTNWIYRHVPASRRIGPSLAGIPTRNSHERTPCKFFFKNTCKKGKACPLSHDPTDPAVRKMLSDKSYYEVRLGGRLSTAYCQWQSKGQPCATWWEGGCCPFVHKMEVDNGPTTVTQATRNTTSRLSSTTNSFQPVAKKQLAPKDKKPCAYFFDRRGNRCRNGEKCPYGHSKAPQGHGSLSTDIEMSDVSESTRNIRPSSFNPPRANPSISESDFPTTQRS
jgi:hypothetical protein